MENKNSLTQDQIVATIISDINMLPYNCRTVTANLVRISDKKLILNIAFSRVESVTKSLKLTQDMSLGEIYNDVLGYFSEDVKNACLFNKDNKYGNNKFSLLDYIGNLHLVTNDITENGAWVQEEIKKRLNISKNVRTK